MNTSFKTILNVVRPHHRFRNYSGISNSFAVTYSEYGDPRKVLEGKLFTFEYCVNPDDVFVKLLAAPVNPADINKIEGSYPIKPQLPAIVGNEGVAEILQVGSNVKKLQKGDRVIFVDSTFGTWRQYGVSSQSQFIKIPNNIPVHSAATLTVNPSTAYRMLKDFTNLNPGDVVIQNGANSAAGQAVIQVAAARGIQTVNIVRDRPEIDNLVESLKKLGANHVVTEDFCRTPQMKDLMQTLPKPKLALNCVGGKSASELLRLLDHGGTLVTYGGMSKKPVIVPTGSFIFKELKLSGFWMSKWYEENAENPERDAMIEDLCNMIQQGKLVPPPFNLTPIENFQEAVDAALQGFSGKKQLLLMGRR